MREIISTAAGTAVGCGSVSRRGWQGKATEYSVVVIHF